MQFRPVGAEVFRADGRDTHDEADSSFSQIC